MGKEMKEKRKKKDKRKEKIKETKGKLSTLETPIRHFHYLIHGQNVKETPQHFLVIQKSTSFFLFVRTMLHSRMPSEQEAHFCVVIKMAW